MARALDWMCRFGNLSCQEGGVLRGFRDEAIGDFFWDVGDGVRGDEETERDGVPRR